MQRINEFIKTNIFSSVLLAVLGFILIIKPDTVLSIIAYATAIILLAVGINAVIRYVQDHNQTFNLFGGVVSLIASIFLFFRYETVVSFIPFILGIYIVISSALKLEYVFRMKSENNPKYLNILFSIIVSLICGIFLIFNPFSSTLVITRVIGVLIMIYSILDIYQTHLLKKEIKNFII